MKNVIKLLQAYAQTKGIDVQLAFTEMLDFFITTFSPELFLKFKGNLVLLFENRRKTNPSLFEALIIWVESAQERIAEDGTCDFFGDLYEMMFLGKTKASAMGQFFTPLPLCQAIASVLKEDNNDITVGEPSCGSGRNVLAHWQLTDKLKMPIYRCEDLDPTSVKMCALNMMINGLIGTVICHDSLDPGSYHFGFAINEVRHPLPSPYYSIRPIAKNEYSQKLK